MRIAICKNATGAGADTSCDTGTTWAAGWLMFVDTDGDGMIDSGEPILRVHQALPSGLAVSDSGVGNIVYARPVGNVTPVGSWKICDTRVGDFGRQITVAATGRITSAVATCP